MSAELHVLSTNYLPLCRTAVAKIIKKHDKIASELPQSAETVRTREAVIWTIENERSFWSKGGRLVEEMEGEVKVCFNKFASTAGILFSVWLPNFANTLSCACFFFFFPFCACVYVRTCVMQNLQWELTKYTVRGKQDAIVW